MTTRTTETATLSAFTAADLQPKKMKRSNPKQFNFVSNIDSLCTDRMTPNMYFFIQADDHEQRRLAKLQSLPMNIQLFKVIAPGSIYKATSPDLILQTSSTTKESPNVKEQNALSKHISRLEREHKFKRKREEEPARANVRCVKRKLF